MLPDLPSLKKELEKAFQSAFRKRVNAYMGVLNECRRNYIKEGNRVITIRPDGTRDETELKEASTETIIRLEEVPSLSIKDRVLRLDEAASEMARKISEHAFRTIFESVEKVGNVIDGSGKVISPEAILAVYEKIHLEFDEYGNPNELTMVVAPGMERRAREALEALHRDPELKERFDTIIEKKRMEWRDREVARRLVG